MDKTFNDSIFDEYENELKLKLKVVQELREISKGVIKKTPIGKVETKKSIPSPAKNSKSKKRKKFNREIDYLTSLDLAVLKIFREKRHKELTSIDIAVSLGRKSIPNRCFVRLIHHKMIERVKKSIKRPHYFLVTNYGLVASDSDLSKLFAGSKKFDISTDALDSYRRKNQGKNQ